MTTIDPKFGQEMRRLRNAKGLSQRKLGEIVGLGSGYISRIERCEFKPPSEEKIIKIADALGANRDYLLSLSGKVSSDVLNAVKDDPQKMSDAVRSMDKMGEWQGIALVILIALFVFAMRDNSTQGTRESKKEWSKLLTELRKETEKLPRDKQLDVIQHIRQLMNEWEKDVRR